MHMPDLLFEIGAEEMPGHAVLPALTQMERLIAECLQRLRLSHGQVSSYGTPRRLALVVKDVADRQPDREVEYKGPPAARAFTEGGDPTDAAFGFANARGVAVNDLTIKKTENGIFAFATVKEQGKPAKEVLPGPLGEIITSLTFPKTMRWADLDVRFIRAIRWLVAMLGGEVLPVEVGDVAAGNVTRGHRVLGPVSVTLTDASEYVAQLEKAHVIADHRRRRETIIQQAQAAAAEFNGTAVLRGAIVEENNFMAEWPVCIVGSFGERYLELPDEVVAMVMEKHQGYFPVAAESGALMAKFIIVANVGKDAADIVRAGNEKVIEARLADAEFYIREDTKTSPEQALEKLRRVTFLENLGTLYDKTMRLQVLVKWLGERVGADKQELAAFQRAALLSKTDQVTQMIGDTKLAELQGTIGAYYAVAAGEDQVVADAIAEQYMPVGADGALPASVGAALLAIADKIDNLASSFYLGMEPSGTKDPMGLRRQAQGIIAIAFDRRIHFSFDDIVSLDMGLLPEVNDEDAPSISEAAERLKALMASRLESALEAAGVGYDIVRAVLATKWNDVVEVMERGQALAKIRAEDTEFEAAVDTATRPANIVRPTNLAPGVDVEPALFVEPIEERLWDAYEETAEEVKAALSDSADYGGVWEALKSLRKPIDEYFLQVMVNVEDDKLRTNRLALMRRLDRLYMKLADFTEIVQ